MTYYDIMFESINEQYASGEITFEQAYELNDLAYDKYMTEMKSQAEYRERKLKEKYNYDPKTKTITVDGERAPLKILHRKDRSMDLGKKRNKYLDETHYNHMNNEPEGNRRLLVQANDQIQDAPLVSDSMKKKFADTTREQAGTISLDSNTFKYGHKKRAESTLLHEFTHRNEDKLKKKIANGTATEKEKKEYDKLMNKIKDFHNKNSNRTVDDHDSEPFETYADKKASDVVGSKTYKKSLRKMKQGQYHVAHASRDKELKENKKLGESIGKEYKDYFDYAGKQIPYRYGALNRDSQSSHKYRFDALKAANKIDKDKNTEK